MNQLAIRERERRGQCPFRRDGCCGAIDCAIGVGQDGGVRVTLDECDACYEAGRGVGTASAAWRKSYVAMFLKNVKASIEHARAPLIEAVIRRHCQPEEAVSILRRTTVRLGRERAMRLAERFGIEQEVAGLFDSASPQALADEADRMEAWLPHGQVWEEIEREIADGGLQPTPVTWFGAAWSFLRAMWSSRGGRRGVDRETLEVRHISCFGKDLKGRRIKDPCPSLRRSDKGWHYCGHCKCGERKIARLDGDGFTKLMHPSTTCVRSMPGFATLTVSGTPHESKSLVVQESATGPSGGADGKRVGLPILRNDGGRLRREEGVPMVAVPVAEPGPTPSRSMRVGNEAVSRGRALEPKVD